MRVKFETMKNNRNIDIKNIEKSFLSVARKFKMYFSFF